MVEFPSQIAVLTLHSTHVATSVFSPDKCAKVPSIDREQ